MKRVFIALLTLSTSVTMMAQSKWGETPADSIKCWEDYNIFGSLVQTKAYSDAYEYWDRVYTNCPQAHLNLFIYAPRVLKSKIDDATTEEQKMKFADQLIESYDKRLEYFPEKEAYVIGEKASALMKYKDDNSAAFAAYQKAFDLESKEMSPAQVNGYFLSSVKIFNNKEIELDQLLDVYANCQEAIAQNRIALTNEINALNEKQEAAGSLDKKDARDLKSAETNLKAYKTVESNIEKAIAPLLSCSNLAIIVSEEAYEANKTNKTWLARAARMLQKERTNDEGETEDCTDNPLFTKIAETMVAMEPTSDGYRAIAKMNYKKKEYSKALEFYKKAVEIEKDPDVLGDDYLAISMCYKLTGSLSNAKTFAVKAKSAIPSSGKPYLMLASIYADGAGSCGENIVEKNGVYWAAINQCAKAKSVDPDIASQANKLIAAFQKGVPQKSVAFQLGYTEGQTLTLGCWIGETVTIKFY